MKKMLIVLVYLNVFLLADRLPTVEAGGVGGGANHCAEVNGDINSDGTTPPRVEFAVDQQ